MECVITISVLAISAFFLLLDIHKRVIRCEHPGCREDGIDCYLIGDDGDCPSHRYCEKHAAENGFCQGCGLFYAGVDSFDFGDGLCKNCRGDADECDEEWEEELDREGYY